MRRTNVSHASNLEVITSYYKDVEPTRFVNSILRESSPVDEFYFDKIECSDLDKPIKVFRDPIYELFNQDRLNRLGSTVLDAWIKSMMMTKNNPLSELREKCSDTELLSIMKSRYSQTPSEIMNWARYLNNNLSELENQVSLAREEQIKLQEANNIESANVVAAVGAPQVNAN